MDIKEWLPEFKVSAETDEDLLSYFLKTEYVTEVVKKKKWLVLGRKGTGKTAIYEYIKKTKVSEIDGFRALTLSFKDYPWPTHHLYKEAMEGELSAYQKSWFYLFIVQAVAELIKVKESLKEPISQDLKSAKKILQQIYGNPFPSLIEVIKSKIIRVDKFSTPKVKAGDIDLPLFSGQVVKIVPTAFRIQKGLNNRWLNEPFCDCNTFPRIQRSFFFLHPEF